MPALVHGIDEFVVRHAELLTQRDHEGAHLIGDRCSSHPIGAHDHPTDLSTAFCTGTLSQSQGNGPQNHGTRGHQDGTKPDQARAANRLTR